VRSLSDFTELNVEKVEEALRRILIVATYAVHAKPCGSAGYRCVILEACLTYLLAQVSTTHWGH